MSPLSFLTTILDESTNVTTPSFLATTQTPESLAVLYSIPVPTIGESVVKSGTAWRCILEPIKALVTSSFCKNGIRAVAMETSCLGDTSIKSTLSGATWMLSSLKRQVTLSFVKWLESSKGSFACAIVYFSSSSAGIYIISSVTTGASPVLSTTL